MRRATKPIASLFQFLVLPNFTIPTKVVFTIAIPCFLIWFLIDLSFLNKDQSRIKSRNKVWQYRGQHKHFEYQLYIFTSKETLNWKSLKYMYFEIFLLNEVSLAVLCCSVSAEYIVYLTHTLVIVVLKIKRKQQWFN